MALSFGGSGFSAQKSIDYMSQNKSLMDSSLEKIASGKRILNGADDSGGLSVAMKLQNQINTTNSQQSTVENAKSYVEAQSTALQSAAGIVAEIQTLKNTYDTTKSANAADPLLGTYKSQFQDLRAQLSSLEGETLNGTKLFDRGSDMTVSNVRLTDLGFHAALEDGGQDLGNLVDTNVTLDNVTTTNLTNIYDKVSGLVTEAAGDASTLGFASDYLSNMSINLESAHGRIMDVDLAEESANLAKYSMQYEAAATAVAQANVAMGAVLDLLLGSINKD